MFRLVGTLFKIADVGRNCPARAWEFSSFKVHQRSLHAFLMSPLSQSPLAVLGAESYNLQISCRLLLSDIKWTYHRRIQHPNPRLLATISMSLFKGVWL